VPLRDLFRRRRDRRERVDLDQPLTEDDVRRIQQVQRAAPKSVRVRRRAQ
jgi:nitroreductase